MLFNSTAFLIFFPVTTIIYYIVPDKYKYIWLLIVSYVFYLSQDGGIALFLVISTVLTWITGYILYNVNIDKRKILLFICVILNLVPLLVFKYANFALGLAGTSKTLNLLVPAGISYYTLQSTSYVIDCFRRKYEPEKNPVRYALFVSFYPCILSGPIERAGNILPQTEGNDHSFETVRVKEGLMVMLWGYFLKLAVASRLSILTDMVYDNYSDISGTAVLFGVIAFSLQIYCDFAGYSYIALGSARILGYNIICNFKQPYLSGSVREFWRRWHISLSGWFRDYLYIPLGGSRKGNARRYVNLIIVFTVSGLWHGAELTFLVWGLLHGVLQTAELILKSAGGRIGNFFLNKSPGSGARFIQGVKIAITYAIVTLAWIPFRASDLSEAGNVFLGLFRDNSVRHLFDGTIFDLGLGTFNLLFAVVSLLVVFAVDLACNRKNCMIYELFVHANVPLRWGFYYLLVVLILFSANLSTQEFLYQAF
ncbi:MAG: MBOAT family protein [Lachnospiraceae bacterium]|nr:MBOAT family protein [Lachnospiraceae bacterium]